MTQAKLAWELLEKFVGYYHGKGVNHEKQNFSHNFSIESLSSSKTLEISATAVGDNGEVYHSEKSWIGFDLTGALVLYVTSNNHPGITPHNFYRIDETADCKNVVFRFGNPDDRHSFREEITLSLFSDGSLTHRYAWGLPGGDFEPRSSARVKTKNLSGISHVIVMVSDMAKSIDFYKNTIGFELKFHSDNWTEFAMGSVSLALHGGGTKRDKNQTEPHESKAGTASINFDVKNVESTYQELSSRGVKFTLPPTARQNEGIMLAVAQDPDGFEICFAQRL